MYGTIVIFLGFLLDLLFGDPIGRFHPVCLIGKVISGLEKVLYGKEASDRARFRRGILLVIMVLLITFVVTYGAFYGILKLHFAAGILFAALLCDSTLAMRDLQLESMRVHKALGDKDHALQKGREAVSRIVGRDVRTLDERGVMRAAVETVAENTTDGVVAPLFYLFLGGPVLAMLYKAINTMDSMIGYKNEKYLYFGRAAAKLDDVVNFLPARIAALLWCVAAALTGADYKGAFRIWRRDRFCHESPNSAQTESACAGSLGIRLAGDAWYFGKKKEKPYIGDATREIERKDIFRVNVLMYVTAFLMLLIGLILRVMIMLAMRYLILS
ncbi:MAG: cobalamin biosynthesis protein CobD [Lachnospiraceae bacterium]|nr:cobalamin biosynthesis protein CobD [Lachnospiraceae bacterium]